METTKYLHVLYPNREEFEALRELKGINQTWLNFMRKLVITYKNQEILT